MTEQPFPQSNINKIIQKKKEERKKVKEENKTDWLSSYNSSTFFLYLKVFALRLFVHNAAIFQLLTRLWNLSSLLINLGTETLTFMNIYAYPSV